MTYAEHRIEEGHSPAEGWNLGLVAIVALCIEAWITIAAIVAALT